MLATAPDLRALCFDDLMAGLSQASHEEYTPWLAELQQRRRNVLRRWLLDYGACPNDLDDLSQNVWLSVIQYRDSYRPGRDAKAWLKSIVAHTVHNNHRFEMRKKRRPDGELGSVHNEWEPSDIATRDPLDLLIDREQSAELHTKVDALPTNLREVIHLYYFEGLMHADIATRLNIPIGTSMTRLQRAIRVLRGDLDKQEEVECTLPVSESSEAMEYIAL